MLSESFKRYSENQKEIISGFFNKLAITVNKTGRISEGKKLRIIKSWDDYPADVVISALEVYMKMDIPVSGNGRGKNEKYVLGIMKNKKEQRDWGKAGCKVWRKYNGV